MNKVKTKRCVLKKIIVIVTFDLKATVNLAGKETRTNVCKIKGRREAEAFR